MIFFCNLHFVLSVLLLHYSKTDDGKPQLEGGGREVLGANLGRETIESESILSTNTN